MLPNGSAPSEGVCRRVKFLCVQKSVNNDMRVQSLQCCGCTYNSQHHHRQ
jgi:hypothetical protein